MPIAMWFLPLVVDFMEFMTYIARDSSYFKDTRYSSLSLLRILHEGDFEI
jgi:hypothetical protein